MPHQCLFMTELKELLKGLDETQLDLLKYSNDPILFMREVLGLECEWFHEEWLRAFEKYKFITLLAPRVHGKTTTIASYIIWRIVRDRNINILIITINQAKANNMMTFVQECLTTNPKLKRLFGEFKGGANWSRDHIRVKISGVTIPSKEHTLEVIGQGSRIVSSHYDLIIMDDVTDDDNSRTETRRRDLEDWYDGPLVGTFVGHTKVIDVGTRWCEDDFHNYLMHKPGFHTLKYMALLNPEEVDEGARGKVLWPKHIPWDEEMARELGLPDDTLTLKFIREHQGETFFQMQYQNNIIASGLSKFKPEWIDSAINKWRKIGGILPSDAKKYIGVDIGGEDVTSDWGVSTVISVDRDGNIYIIDSNRSHSTLNHQFDIMKSLDNKHHTSRIGMESVAQQTLMVRDVTRKNPNLPIIPIKTSRTFDRDIRTDRLALLFETGRIYLNPELKYIIDELRVYPRGKHDDSIDSVSFALEASQEGGNIDWSRVANVITARRTYNITKL